MGLFTPPQFLFPTEWVRAIPLIQGEIVTHVFEEQLDIDALQDWVTILKRILREEHKLQRLSSLEDEEPYYPIRMSGRLFGRLQQLLYVSPLTEGDLRSVRAGCGPARTL